MQTKVNRVFLFCPYFQSSDKLVLLPDGKLRHFSRNPNTEDFEDIEDLDTDRIHDYDPGQYCMDKVSSAMHNLCM